MRPRPPPVRLVLAIGATVIAACGDVAHPEFPRYLDDRLIVFAVLSPDSTAHPMLVWPVDYSDPLTGTVARVYRASDGVWTLVAETTEAVDVSRCGPRYGGLVIGVAQCLVPAAVLDDGASYRVEVSADDRATAWGVTAAVGAFHVETAVLLRNSDQDSLSSTWTPSLATHRYMASLRPRSERGVFSRGGEGWYIEVDDTSMTTPVPDDAIEAAVQPLTLDVAAFDEHLYSFITSGNGDTSFSVPPIQNVVGGFGIVGSVRYRSLAVTEK